MKTLICYAGKYSTAKKVADELAGLLGSQTKTHDLKYPLNVRIEDFDAVVIGGSVYMGKLNPLVNKFCIQHESIMLNKYIGVFICGLQEDKFKQIYESNIPQNIRTFVTSCKFVGGEIQFSRLNFLEKWIIRKVAGIHQDISKINHKSIQELADELSLHAIFIPSFKG
jgi:menaquinone-dependent protoporphyrinogen oxidase